MTAAANTIKIALQILKIVAAIAFLTAGASKLIGFPATVEMFALIGLGQGFRYLTGTLEIACALLLFAPAFTYYAATLLAAVMIAALAIERTVLGGSLFPPAALLLILSAIAFLSRARGSRR
jgi:uncharacterized membrane protein YphA (DoxX/SURF4 family)